MKLWTLATGRYEHTDGMWLFELGGVFTEQRRRGQPPWHGNV